MNLFKKHKTNPKHYNVIVKEDRILREVYSIEEAVTILEALKSEGYYDKYIVETSIYSDEDRILEHKLLKPIIYSPEYTVSMAYDITELGNKMATTLADRGVYSYDLLPHNFTFYNGEWILYDFGAFELTPYNAKTQVRNAFKISFSSFELLKLLERKDLKGYFLNRISNKYIMKMLPLSSYIMFKTRLSICQIMLAMKAYKKAYSLLVDFCNQYKTTLPRKVYSFSSSEEENKIFSNISAQITKPCENILCLGENATRWALTIFKDFSDTTICSYVDDYDICDEIYNYVRENKITNIIPAVIYPLVSDDKIPENINYRALYDPFAQERFLSDFVILDLDEVHSGHDFDKLIKNLSYFVKDSLIVKVKTSESEEFRTKFNEYFDSTEIKNIDDKNALIIAKIKTLRKNPEEYKYLNNNRMPESEPQSKKTLEIVKKVLKNLAK